MGRLRDAIRQLLDRLDSPDRLVYNGHVVPCPSCSRDLVKNHTKTRVDPDLIFYCCVCGHASAWHWNGHGPQLIYGAEPGEIEDD